MISQDYLRSLIFGFQDALVSTTGVVVGMSLGSQSRSYVILAGVVTLAVEALSMGAGQYLSEKSVHQMPGSHHRDSLIVGAGLMFTAYIIAGMVPILPVILGFGTMKQLPWLSGGLALGSLFGLGVIKAKLVGNNWFKDGAEMLTIGGLATLIGVIVGLVFKV
jgi:VIT1/CCC1 family predicted Fe2+/Mn2+ transporter